MKIEMNALAAPADTDEVVEGALNLYYLDARADARVAAGVAALDADDIDPTATRLYMTAAERTLLGAAPPLWAPGTFAAGDQVAWADKIWERLAAGTDAAGENPAGNADWRAVSGATATGGLDQTQVDARVAAGFAARDSDDLGEGATNLYMRAPERTKLIGIEEGAEQNRTGSETVALLNAALGGSTWQSGGGGGGGGSVTDLSLGARAADSLVIESSDGQDVTLPAASATAGAGLLSGPGQALLNGAVKLWAAGSYTAGDQRVWSGKTWERVADGTDAAGENPAGNADWRAVSGATATGGLDQTQVDARVAAGFAARDSDDLGEGATNLYMRAPERTKLIGIEEGAEQNRTGSETVALLNAALGGSTWQSGGGGGGGGSVTDLSLGARAADSLVIESSDGQDVTLPAASATAGAGLLSGPGQALLNGAVKLWAAGSYTAGDQRVWSGKTWERVADGTDAADAADRPGTNADWRAVSGATGLDQAAVDARIALKITDDAINTAAPADEATDLAASRQAVAEALAALPAGGSGGGGAVIGAGVTLATQLNMTADTWYDVDFSEAVTGDSFLVLIYTEITSFSGRKYRSTLLGEDFRSLPEFAAAPSSISTDGVDGIVQAGLHAVYFARGADSESIWIRVTDQGASMRFILYPISGGGAAPTPDPTPTPTDTMYWAVGADDEFAEADFLAGASASGQTITIPTFTGDRYQAVAVPHARGEPTSIQESASPFNSIDAFERRAGTTDIGGEPHIILVSREAWYDTTSGTTWTVS